MRFKKLTTSRRPCLLTMFIVLTATLMLTKLWPSSYLQRLLYLHSNGGEFPRLTPFDCFTSPEGKPVLAHEVEGVTHPFMVSLADLGFDLHKPNRNFERVMKGKKLQKFPVSVMMQRVLQRLRPNVEPGKISTPEWVIDVGANVGMATYAASAMGFRVLAFEPVFENLQRLCDGLHLNRAREVVRLYHAVVSDVNKNATIHKVIGRLDNSAISKTAATLALANSHKVIPTTVRSTTLDSLVPPYEPVILGSVTATYMAMAGVHVIMLPYPPTGHSTPFIHFAKGLATLGVAITFIVPDSRLSSFQKPLREDQTFQARSNIHLVPFEFPVGALDPLHALKEWMYSKSDMFSDIVGGLMNDPAESPMMVQYPSRSEAGPPVCILSDMFLGFTQVPSVLTIGPLFEGFSEGGDETLTYRERLQAKKHHQTDTSFEWLDRQPDASVLYICFGSIVKLMDTQIKELALGLEKSGQRFFWVLRAVSSSPKHHHQDTNIKKTNQDLSDILPEGFLERTKSRGIVYVEWAPQLQILAHPAVGGFLSHCGWNSTFESMCVGVPMVAMPIQAEQMMNAIFIDKTLGVAVRVNAEKGGRAETVGQKPIEKAIRTLMNLDVSTTGGTIYRRKAVQVSDTIERAIRSGGSSKENMVLFVELLRIRKASKAFLSMESERRNSSLPLNH